MAGDEEAAALQVNGDDVELCCRSDCWSDVKRVAKGALESMTRAHELAQLELKDEKVAAAVGYYCKSSGLC